MNTTMSNGKMEKLCQELIKNNNIDVKLYEKFHVKRGLRNQDGTGVIAGLTNICNVHGYVVNEGEKQPIDGELIYRGYNVNDIVNNINNDNRYGFEEVVYLLLFGQLPNKEQLDTFNSVLAEYRELPLNFAEDMILKAPSSNIMNKLARSVLALYSYDEDPENQSIEKELLNAMQIIARLPAIMVNAYQVKKRFYDKESLFMHPINPEENTAQCILSLLRSDREYTEEEARLLDLILVLHAEHGGGNNSTFTCRVLTSSGTDAYSAYSGAIGSLKGFRHGGANIKVMEQLEDLKANIKNWEDESEVADYLCKILRKETSDDSGLIYGMGHAVYTLSDPRATILKENVKKLAAGTEIEREFHLLELVEKLTPELFAQEKGDAKVVCANVDMYSGLVYKMLNIPVEIFTPLFAVSRMPGWCAHRMEEILTGKRIIRPGYKSVSKDRRYIPIDER